MASRPVLVGNPGVALTAEDVTRVALGIAQVVRVDMSTPVAGTRFFSHLAASTLLTLCVLFIPQTLDLNVKLQPAKGQAAVRAPLF